METNNLKQDIEPQNRYVVYEYNERVKSSYIGSRFMTRWTEHKEEKPDSKCTIIAENVSEEDAYLLINNAKRNSIDVFYENLPDEMKPKFKNMLDY